MAVDDRSKKSGNATFSFLLPACISRSSARPYPPRKVSRGTRAARKIGGLLSVQPLEANNFDGCESGPHSSKEERNSVNSGGSTALKLWPPASGPPRDRRGITVGLRRRYFSPGEFFFPYRDRRRRTVGPLIIGIYRSAPGRTLLHRDTWLGS